MIHVHVIPHASQEYETIGNWQFTPMGEWMVQVSDLKDWRYHFLIAFHEMIEMALCKERRVDPALVTAFDMGFEAARDEDNDREPGDDPAAPYQKEHQFATRLEHLMADELGIDWTAYEKTIGAV